MKTLILPLLWATIFCFTGNNFSKPEAEPAYHMFETVYLTADRDKMDDFGKGMKTHNQKYHNKAPHTARVWSVRTGPNSGSLVWMKGPLTYSDLDAEEGDGHGKDWRDNVIANCSSSSPTEYWKRQDEYSLPTAKEQPIVQVRFLEINIKEKQGYRMFGLFKQMKETMKSIDGGFSWEIYENEFQQGNLGRHFAIVRGYDKWADFDADIKFEEAFEKVHGEKSYQKFRREMGEVFVNSYDEVWSIVPELGAD